MSLHFITVNTGDDDPDSFHTSDKGKRKKVNLIEGYGAEPPTVDANYGRVSYTQFEFL
jgi:hypothetical protein